MPVRFRTEHLNCERALGRPLTAISLSRQSLSVGQDWTEACSIARITYFPEPRQKRKGVPMLRELRFAIRMLLKQPGFSLIAALTLALGIGATSAIFSLIQGVLLTPPPYQKPEQLVLIPMARTDGRKMDSSRGWAAEQWMDWNKEAKSFDGIAAYDWTFNFLIRNDGSQSMQGMVVTKGYFPVLGLKPLAGRGFADSDFAPGPTKTILLGYEFWQRAFGGDRQIIGKTVRISRWEVAPTVIGVMEPGVRFLPSPGAAKEPNYDVNARVDFWVPVEPDPKYLKEQAWNVVARLRDGTTRQQAQQELAVLAAREAEGEKKYEGFTPPIILVILLLESVKTSFQNVVNYLVRLSNYKPYRLYLSFVNKMFFKLTSVKQGFTSSRHFLCFIRAVFP